MRRHSVGLCPGIFAFAPTVAASRCQSSLVQCQPAAATTTARSRCQNTAGCQAAAVRTITAQNRSPAFVRSLAFPPASPAMPAATTTIGECGLNAGEWVIKSRSKPGVRVPGGKAKRAPVRKRLSRSVRSSPSHAWRCGVSKGNGPSTESIRWKRQFACSAQPEGRGSRPLESADDESPGRGEFVRSRAARAHGNGPALLRRKPGGAKLSGLRANNAAPLGLRQSLTRLMTVGFAHG
jgi:hypothetical protein